MRKPSKDFQTRYDLAKRWQDAVRPVIEEIYTFCAPGRERDFQARPGVTPAMNYHSLGEEVATDLAGDLITYFTPPESRWASYVFRQPVPEDAADQVQRLVQEREDQLFEVIQSSNYYDVAPQWGFECAAHGTPAMWITRGHIMQPVHAEIVPPSELLIAPGHMGLLDRFRQKSVRADTLKAMFDGIEVTLDDPRITRLMERPGQQAKVVWGFWLDWDDPGRPMWRMEITVEGIRVTDERVQLGDLAGSCPLVVGRFNPQPGTPWGRGAGWKALPDLRTLDKIDEVVLTAMDDALLTTLIYPDDGFIDLSEGIIPGRAYPANRGFTRDAIYELQRGANLDYGFFSEERLEQRIRTAFYQDGPRQRGETPPTAAQWLDERRRVQQRLGKPSAPLWSEMIVPMIQRFEFLAVESGEMPEAITHNGQAISVRPISPLQKAQNQDQVMIARSNLEMGAAFLGPEVLGQAVDVIGTLKNIVDKSGDGITVIRDEMEVAIEQPAQPGQ